MELKDFLTIGISILALFISGINYFRERKKSNNVLLRLLILTKSIKSDFDRLIFNRDILHIQIEVAQEDTFQIQFITVVESLESKVTKFYELLLLNQKVLDGDVKRILTGLSVIEENLSELLSFPVKIPEDLESTQVFVNIINSEIEIIDSLIQQYENL